MSILSSTNHNEHLLNQVKAENEMEVNENCKHPSEKHRHFLNSEAARKDFERAKHEWDCVDDIEVSKHDEGHEIPKIISTPLTTFDEVLDHFKSCDMSEYMSNIVPTVSQTRLTSFLRFVIGPPYLDCTLEENRNLLFAIAGCPLKNDEALHLRVLQTIYKQLTNNRMDVARFGPHWDFIGFQGNDPATDLRGVGFLGLMHLLYMVTNPSTISLARQILKLSHHSTQNFPFSVMGINITRIVLQTLREERLNKECNKRKDVITVTNEFYIGIFLHLYEIWRKNGVTIADSGWVLKGVENDAKKRPKSIFQTLEQFMKANTCDDDEVGKTNRLTTCTAEATPKISHMKPYPMNDVDSNFTNIAFECNSNETRSSLVDTTHDRAMRASIAQFKKNYKCEQEKTNHKQEINQELFV